MTLPPALPRLQALVVSGDTITGVGAEPYINQWRLRGDVIKRAACTPELAYALAVHPCGVTAIGGSVGGSVDVLSEFGSTIATLRCR